MNLNGHGESGTQASADHSLEQAYLSKSTQVYDDMN